MQILYHVNEVLDNVLHLRKKFQVLNGSLNSSRKAFKRDFFRINGFPGFKIPGTRIEKSLLRFMNGHYQTCESNLQLMSISKRL